MGDGRGWLMLVCLAFLGLMVGIDGLLKGEWLRSLAGWAWFGAWVYLGVRGVPEFLFPRRWRDRLSAEFTAAMIPGRSWPLMAVGILFALVCFGGALWILLAPFDDLLAWSRQSARLLRGLSSIGGEGFARIVLAGLFAFAGGAASYTALVRFRA